MEAPEHAELTKAVRALRAALIQIIEHVDCVTLEVERLGGSSEERVGGTPGASLLRLDEQAFLVHWCDRTCHLGYTLPFRVLQVLARRPNQYLTTDHLLTHIWAGHRSRTAVRSAVSDLRRRLAEAEMADLAALIDGSSRGHYGLMLSRHLQANPTEIPQKPHRKPRAGRHTK